MYPIAAPPPIAVIQRPEETPISLRINQRITAQVMQIASDHVTLMMEGVQVVARLATSDQAAQLAERQKAQFVVRGFADGTLVLQLATPEATTAAATPAPQLVSADLAATLLKQIGVQPNENTTHIARALIGRGLPVTPETVQALEQALAGLGQWGADEAHIAAALKANGLPLSAETIALFRQPTGALGENLGRLQAQLRSLQTANLPPQVAELATKAAEILNRLKVDWSASPQTIAAQLRDAVSILGRSLEHDLARLAAGAKVPDGLLTLAQLQKELSASPQTRPLADELGRFLDAARVMQFSNAAVERNPAQAHWLNLGFALTQPPPAQAQDQSAHVRVAYRSEGGQDQLDPNNTRLVLQVELEEAQVLEVDLSVVGRQVGARVVASNDDLRAWAETELPSLADGLQQVGFALKTARCEVGQPSPEVADLTADRAPYLLSDGPPPPLSKLNLEV